mmetsp:Transcript_67673/g.163625  ORF Transcript_67673/g.163625 Transcript_67673/m.163625 type:complete len:270 (+) Transcript_67673:103-912(+)
MLFAEGTAHSVFTSRSRATGMVRPELKSTTLFFFTKELRRRRTTKAATAATTATPPTPAATYTAKLVPVGWAGPVVVGAPVCAETPALREATLSRRYSSSTSPSRSSMVMPERASRIAPSATRRSKSSSLSSPVATSSRRRAATSTGVESRASGLPSPGTTTEKSTCTKPSGTSLKRRPELPVTELTTMFFSGTSRPAAVAATKPASSNSSALVPAISSSVFTIGSGAREPTSEHRSEPGGHTPGAHDAKQAVLYDWHSPNEPGQQPPH